MIYDLVDLSSSNFKRYLLNRNCLFLCSVAYSVDDSEDLEILVEIIGDWIV